MYNNYVVKHNGEQKKILNMSWLIKNWKYVEWFSIEKTYVDQQYDYQCVLTAFLNHKKYRSMVSYWSSLTILIFWLNRPIFKGLKCRLFQSIWYEIGGELTNKYIEQKIISTKPVQTIEY